ncbi:hypothetical protein [Chryseobacterium sp. P1-3]|uniref:hypothetical protein n=1 Tax=Chryseobacterium sp. (strain P1-3) TaxID=1517683 RepID=UPI000AA1E5DB|nr:hypothetical protein [Chryseobacterium sp. P1-3]
MKLRITLISICASFLMNAQVLNTNGLGSDDLPGTTFKLNIDAFKRSIDANRKSPKKN